jgi:hypothetical protein
LTTQQLCNESGRHVKLGWTFQGPTPDSIRRGLKEAVADAEGKADERAYRSPNDAVIRRQSWPFDSYQVCRFLLFHFPGLCIFQGSARRTARVAMT